MRRLRIAWLGVALAGAAADEVAANDKEVTAYQIPAAACSRVDSGATSLLKNFGAEWALSLGPMPTAKFAYVACAINLTNVRSGASTAATRISRFRVSYLDSDGNGTGSQLLVRLLEARTSTSGQLLANLKCTFDSNTNGSGATSYTRATRACALTLQAGSAYIYEVTLRAGKPSGNTSVNFVGIDFPP